MRRSAAASTSCSSATRSSSDDDLVRAAEPFRRACDLHGALFVLNDRPDLVERADADGVHVGQRTCPSRTRGARRPRSPRGPFREHRGRAPGRPGLFRRRRRFRHADEAGGRARRARARSRGARPVARALVCDRRHRCGTIEDVVASGAAGVAVVRAVRDAARSGRGGPRPTRAAANDRCGRRRGRQGDSTATDRLARVVASSGRDRRAPAHARGAHGRLLRPRGRDRDAARRRDGTSACGFLCGGAPAASARLPQSGRDRGALPQCARAGRLGERPAAARARGVRHVLRSRHRRPTRVRGIISGPGDGDPCARSIASHS